MAQMGFQPFVGQVGNQGVHLRQLDEGLKTCLELTEEARAHCRASMERADALGLAAERDRGVVLELRRELRALAGELRSELAQLGQSVEENSEHHEQEHAAVLDEARRDADHADRSLADELLRKLAELNEKLGSNMQVLEDELTEELRLVAARADSAMAAVSEWGTAADVVDNSSPGLACRRADRRQEDEEPEVELRAKLLGIEARLEAEAEQRAALTVLEEGLLRVGGECAAADAKAARALELAERIHEAQVAEVVSATIPNSEAAATELAEAMCERPCAGCADVRQQLELVVARLEALGEGEGQRERRFAVIDAQLQERLDSSTVSSIAGEWSLFERQRVSPVPSSPPCKAGRLSAADETNDRDATSASGRSADFASAEEVAGLRRVVTDLEASVGALPRFVEGLAKVDVSEQLEELRQTVRQDREHAANMRDHWQASRDKMLTELGEVERRQQEHFGALEQMSLSIKILGDDLLKVQGSADAALAKAACALDDLAAADAFADATSTSLDDVAAALRKELAFMGERIDAIAAVSTEGPSHTAAVEALREEMRDGLAKITAYAESSCRDAGGCTKQDFDEMCREIRDDMSMLSRTISRKVEVDVAKAMEKCEVVSTEAQQRCSAYADAALRKLEELAFCTRERFAVIETEVRHSNEWLTRQLHEDLDKSLTECLVVAHREFVDSMDGRSDSKSCSRTCFDASAQRSTSQREAAQFGIDLAAQISVAARTAAAEQRWEPDAIVGAAAEHMADEDACRTGGVRRLRRRSSGALHPSQSGAQRGHATGRYGAAGDPIRRRAVKAVGVVARPWRRSRRRGMYRDIRGAAIACGVIFAVAKYSGAGLSGGGSGARRRPKLREQDERWQADLPDGEVLVVAPADPSDAQTALREPSPQAAG
eukprot:CAMPEP_0176040168 /NCGR_PEP_ID=MMETSP0120_2-20121206/19916_1 /TAXON_ID=160619 /ORGANISM="Kryptoperidinium foliaceum, Strain CCMP 1326" /LENGTH=895 /DNA_ID=CAMNT_0017373565 /DNA_START=30 /DNA_END=2718 /DNA_ORIENTATION=-